MSSTLCAYCCRLLVVPCVDSSQTAVFFRRSFCGNCQEQTDADAQRTFARTGGAGGLAAVMLCFCLPPSKSNFAPLKSTTPAAGRRRSCAKLSRTPMICITSIVAPRERYTCLRLIHRSLASHITHSLRRVLQHNSCTHPRVAFFFSSSSFQLLSPNNTNRLLATDAHCQNTTSAQRAFQPGAHGTAVSSLRNKIAQHGV